MKPECHPLYDRQRHEIPPTVFPDKTPPCNDPLCLQDLDQQGICQKCPDQLVNTVPLSPRPGWGGRRAGAGAPAGNFNRLKDGRQSALIRRAVDILVEHHELRPFLLLIARAAVEGQIPQTTRRVILKALGKKIGNIQLAAHELRRLRDAT